MLPEAVKHTREGVQTGLIRLANKRVREGQDKITQDNFPTWGVGMLVFSNLAIETRSQMDQPRGRVLPVFATDSHLKTPVEQPKLVDYLLTGKCVGHFVPGPGGVSGQEVS